jgi:hypothetical protein
MQSDPRDLNPDCKDALRQPLSKPPLLARLSSYDQDLDNSTFNKRATASKQLLGLMTTNGLNILQPAVLAEATIFVALSLIIVASWILHTTYLRLVPRYSATRFHIPPGWVSDHIARLQPWKSRLVAIDSVEQKSPQISWHAQRRRRNAFAEGSEWLDPVADNKPAADENEEEGGMSEWITTKKDIFAFDPTPCFSVVKLLLEQLHNSGYGNFAFDRLPPGIEPYHYIRHDKPTSAYRRCSNLVIGPRAFVPSDHLFLLKVLSTALRYWRAWVIKVPGFQIQKTSAGYVNVNSKTRYLKWGFWKHADLGSAEVHYKEPILHVAGNGSEAIFLFENIDMVDYDRTIHKIER